MRTRCSPRTPIAVACCLAASGIVAERAPAQYSGDVFNPYSAAYRSSSFPVYQQTSPYGGRRPTPPGLGSVPGFGAPTNESELSRFEFDRSRFSEPNRFGLNSPLNPERSGAGLYDRSYRPNSPYADVEQKIQELYEERDYYYREARRSDLTPEQRAEMQRQFQNRSRAISAALSSRNAPRLRNDDDPRQDVPEARRDDGSAPGLEEFRGDQAPDDGQVRSYRDLLQVCRRLDRLALRVTRPAASPE